MIAETSEWLVVNKAPGWLTIPGRPGNSNQREKDEPVLSRWMESRFGQLWVVHRIDRETSGVVLFARTAEAHRKANTWFQRHQVKKTYHFLAAGVAPAPMLLIKQPIEGAPSTTQVEVKERYGTASFLGQAVPLTGRRHQIRIHLALEGAPLLGDVRYQGPRFLEIGESKLEVARVALHAARLELPSREVFEAAWPEDFAEWVAVLRKANSK